MKLIVAGGRDFSEVEMGNEAIAKCVRGNNVTEIVCGKAKGGDTVGENWAIANNLEVSEFPANWKLYKNGAGPKRNAKMGDYADILLAFWDGKSTGTKHMIDYMRKLKKPVMVVLYNQEDTDNEW